MRSEVLQGRTSYMDDVLLLFCYSLKYCWPLWPESEIFQWSVEDFSGLGPVHHR